MPLYNPCVGPTDPPFLGSGTTFIPSGSTASYINSILQQKSSAGGGDVFLEACTYYAEAPIYVPSNVFLRGQGRELTRIVANFSVTASRADDPTNCLIGITGSLLTSVCSSSLRTTCQAGSTIILVGSPYPAASALSGGYLYFRGNALADQSTEDSDGSSVVLHEIVPISSNDSSGNLTASIMTSIHHATGSTVLGVSPVVAAGIADIDMDATGGSIATGIYVGYSIDVKIDRVSGAGFSRGLIDVENGARDFNIGDVKNRGECNSIVTMISSLNGTVERVRCNPLAAKRNHNNGIPRAGITMRQRCTNIDLIDCRLTNMCIGFMLWGGKHVRYTDCYADNMNPDAAYSAMVTAGEHIDTNWLGAGFSGGAAPLGYAEFAHDVQFTNCSVGNCTTSYNDYRILAWYFHDSYEVLINSFTMRHIGSAGLVAGMSMVDVGGAADQLLIVGYTYGLRTNNVDAGIDVRYCTINCSNSGGSLGVNATIPVQLNHTQAGLRFKYLSCTNGGSFIRFGGNFADNSFIIERYVGNAGQEYAWARICYSTSSMTVNDLIEVDQSNEPNVALFVKPRTGVNDGRVGVICVGGPYDVTTGYAMCSLLPGMGPTTVTFNTGSFKKGDYVVGDPTNLTQVAPSGTVGNRTILGRVWSGAKAAGSTGIGTIF